MLSSRILQSICIVYFDGDNLNLYSRQITDIYNLLSVLYSTVTTLNSERNKQCVSPNIYNILIHFSGSAKEEFAKGQANFKKERQNNLHVDYYSFKYDDPLENIERQCRILYDSYFENIKSADPVSVAVFDYDDTIVDANQNFFYDKICEDIQEYRTCFDYLILWTHGSTDYIKEELKKKKALNNLFDVVIAKQREFEYGENKGKGAILKILNKSFHVAQISYSLLVDDKDENFMQDYTFFIKPTKVPRHFYRAKLKDIEKLIDSKKNVTL